MRTTHLRGSTPPPDDGFAVIIEALAAMSAARRNAFLAFFAFWQDLPKERRAIFAKTLNPDLTDEAVARLVGISRRHLLRWDGYKRCKPTLDDFKASRPRSDFSSRRRRGFGNPDQRDGCHNPDMSEGFGHPFDG